MLKELLLHLLYPKKCILCRKLLRDRELDLCTECRTDVRPYPYGAANPHPKGKTGFHFLDSFTAVWYYESNVRSSLLRYKFYNTPQLASGYGRLLGMKILQQGPGDFDYLTWVPVSRERKRQRGYDQSELLAKAVGRELGVRPVRLLTKIRNTPPQSKAKTAEARKANILGAFSVTGNADLQGKTVLLLDDIFTTGATSDECARVLLLAGAKSVHCAAVAAGAER